MEIYKTNLKPWNMWLPQTICISLLLSKGVKIHTQAPSIFSLLALCLFLHLSICVIHFCLHTLLLVVVPLHIVIVLPSFAMIAAFCVATTPSLYTVVAIDSFCVVTSTIRNHKFSKGSTEPKCLNWPVLKVDVHFDQRHGA
jgi:hypothetical protein